MKKFKSITFLTAITVLASTGLASQAFAGKKGEKTVSNKTGQSFVIAEFDDNMRRSKYAVMDPVERRPYWYAQNGSANAGRGESGIRTNNNQWCRVRYIYGDDVRMEGCWGGFMYSSHLITGLDGRHYELWFSPSSLSYYKIRNQETGVWYAHDGSANAGRGESGIRTSKEDWCRIIIYHGNSILKVPDECQDTLKKVVAVTAGLASEQETLAEVEFFKNVAFESASEKAGNIAEKLMGKSGTFNAAGVGVGVGVGYGTEAVKKSLGLNAKDANAGMITAEILTTTAVNTSITTMIMAASGASLNPVAIGVGAVVAGSIAGGQALYKASKDTGIQFYPDYKSNPRYNLDLNGIASPLANKPPLALPGTSGSGASSGTPAGQTTTIKSGAGKCLDVHGPCANANGCNVQVWDCNGGSNQKWTLVDGQIKSATGKCLDVHGPCANENGCKVQVWDCNGGPNQKWSDGRFKKGGNNGTVSCNTYCGAAKVDGRPVWGEKVGYCVEAKNESTGKTVPCDAVPGLITDGKLLTCVCAPDVKVKHGDNGTVNCATYCANHQSESHKQCVAAWNNVTNSNGDATCNHLPGLLNGKELTCTCR